MNSINFRSPLAVLVFGAAVAACENPVSSQDHSEPEGLVVRAGATEVIRVAGAGTGATVTGALVVAAGAQSPELTVTFIDHDGDDLTLDPTEHWVSVESDGSATATWQGSAAAGFTGRVTGHTAGATTLRFTLYHGPAGGGHVDEGPFIVPVTVTAMQP
jgi:hypothetical protein